MALRQLPRCRLIEENPERPQIAQVIRLVPAQNFRGHVGQRSYDLALERVGRKCEIAEFLALHAGGQPEIQHLDAPFRRDHDVRAFQVAMHDSAVVRVRQGIGDLRAVARHYFHREARGGKQVAE